MIFKSIIKELFYWCWLPFRWLQNPIYRLRTRSNKRWLKQKLFNRKDCKVIIGEQWHLDINTHVLVHLESTLLI